MAGNTRYTVLFFTVGAMPSADQLAEAAHYGPNVRFRNRIFCDGSVEPCDAIAGECPPEYVAKFPMAVSYVEWMQGKLPPRPIRNAAPQPAPAMNERPFAARVLDSDAPTRKRGAATPEPGREPLPGLAGLTGAIELPPPPPPAEPPPVAAPMALPPPPVD